jgi:molybdopterin converting factor small subunit
MKVRVRLFALARQLAGAEELVLDLAPPATVGTVRQTLVERFPNLAPLLRSSLFALETEYVRDTTGLTHDCELAVIPPVSGG